MKKIEFGQYFTNINIFNIDIFKEWMKLSLKESNNILLEPFAGSGNIIKMIQEIGFTNDWVAYDIEPKEKNIIQQDTIENYPVGFDIGITNPPYLAKNSATRKRINIDFGKYEDLYQVCIEKMLRNNNFVAAIIPESFITSGFFRERLFAFISLNSRHIFSDTDIPVCLALWIKENTKDFMIYHNNNFLGSFNEINKHKLPAEKRNIFKFNDKNGQIGIRCIDNSIPSLEFMDGDCISPDEIKISSRAYTRVSIDFSLSAKDYKNIIKQSNMILSDFRNKTHDLFFTAFKGLRKDGLYRRRMDFKQAKSILGLAFDINRNSNNVI